MRTEDRMLAHKRAVDVERRAQAILKRRAATQAAVARMLSAPKAV